MSMTRSETGMNADTGRNISGLAHLRQSIRIILTTRIGSRVLRRDFGSALMSLVDSNMSGAGLAAIYSAVAVALQKWEPRFALRRVQISSDASDIQAGRLKLDLAGDYVPLGQAIVIEGLIL